jgi:saccharopepsin
VDCGPQSLSWLIYLTIVGVGTSPVQMFRAVIDLNWADMFVPSAACPSCRGHLTYNSSRSPTYEANGTEVHEHYGGLYSDGIVSVDTVTLGDGLEIKHQPFEEVMSWRPVPGYWEDSFDSVLGLAAGDPIFDDPYMPHVLPGPFATMASQGTLDENMVSLLLPHDDRVAGDIMFGGYDENLFKGKLSAHPLYPSNTTHWQVESTAVYLADQSGRMLVNESLAGYPAVLEVGYPYILLPVLVGEKITNATTPDRDNDCHVPSIPCDQVAQLPHLTFNLGGHHYTLTGEDYIVRTQVPFCGAKYYCVPIVGGASGVEDMIVLGSSFLKRFYSVYNLDTRTIHRTLRYKFLQSSRREVIN